MLFRSRFDFLLAAVVLAGCSDGANPAETTGAPDATADAHETADAPEMEAGPASDSAPDVLSPTSDGGCVCSDTRDSGVFETSFSCFCVVACADYATIISTYCGLQLYSVVESSFTGCSVKEVSYDFGPGKATSFFDTTTGAFVGGRYHDDTPAMCPGTSQKISGSIATGIYEVPPSCVPAGQRDPCPSDGGPSDAALDGGPSDAALDGGPSDAALDGGPSDAASDGPVADAPAE